MKNKHLQRLTKVQSVCGLNLTQYGCLFVRNHRSGLFSVCCGFMKKITIIERLPKVQLLPWLNMRHMGAFELKIIGVHGISGFTRNINVEIDKM